MQEQQEDDKQFLNIFWKLYTIISLTYYLGTTWIYCRGLNIGSITDIGSSAEIGIISSFESVVLVWNLFSLSSLWICQKAINKTIKIIIETAAFFITFLTTSSI